MVAFNNNLLKGLKAMSIDTSGTTIVAVIENEQPAQSAGGWVLGTDGADYLDYSMDFFVDRIKGLDGDDVIFGSFIGTRIRGGDGDDLIYGHVGDDELDGGGDNDTILDFGGYNQIFGRDGNDLVIVHGGDNDVNLGSGDDQFEAYGPGINVIIAGRGNDLIDVRETYEAQFARLGRGDDTFLGGDGNDNVRGGRDDDFIVGNGGSDTIRGNQGDDTLVGGDGNDRLIGGNGRDLLHGGSGADELRGGSGDDMFVFDLRDTIRDDQGENTYVFDPNGDSVGRSMLRDFSSADRLDMSYLGDQVFQFRHEGRILITGTAFDGRPVDLLFDTPNYRDWYFG